MNENNWVKVEPEIWKFENKGDSIEGAVVMRRADGGNYNNESYVIENSNESFVVFGTTVLENKMKLVNLGDVVRIVYEGVVNLEIILDSGGKDVIILGILARFDCLPQDMVILLDSVEFVHYLKLSK